MKEFINPKSMLTPGVAGSLMMFLVNGITFQFPEISARYLALILSFIIGGIVFFSEITENLAVFQKVFYWFINSLVIFVVGFGTANFAMEVSGGASKAGIPHTRIFPSVSTVFAQNPPGGDATSSVPSPGRETIHSSSDSQRLRTLEEKLTAEKAENERLKKQLELIQRERNGPEQQKTEKTFFKRW